MSGNLAARAGRWSAQHRWRAIFGWLAFVLVAVFIGSATGQNMLSDVEMGNGESQRADRAIEAAAFPDYAEERVLVQGRRGVRFDPAVRTAVADAVRRMSGVPYVYDIQSPLAIGNAQQISRDGRSALVEFKLAGDDDLTEERVDATLATTAAVQRAHPSVRVEQFGDASADKALNKSYEDDFRKAEVTAVPVTLVILLVAFGSLVAAGIPLVLGLTAVFAALGLLGPISQVIPVDDVVASVVLLIGLAVGVDYSMFYVRRKLEERDHGKTGDAALATAAATSGRAVLISGMTVIVAMAGMFLAGNAVFTSFGVGTITVVAVAMLGSVTVLPALLATLGDRVEWGRVPFIARRRHRGDSKLWGAILDRVLRRPAVSLALGAGLLLAAALPAIGMHTMSPGASGLPRHLPIVQTYDRMQAAFPGGPLPAAIVVHADDVTTPAITEGIAGMVERARASGRITGPDTTTVSPDKTVAIVTLPLPGNGTDAQSDAALAELRTEVVPATIDRVPGTETNITGLTAASRDFNDVMKARLPIVVAFVLALAFVLLLRTFRSLVIPLTAIALNLLSVAAAYGVVKLIFQDGNLESILGFQSLGGVISWLPLFLFVVLFGLSMDYHVFILSRVREAVDSGMPTERAVSHAIKATAGVVTSAAVVMVAVFSIFATLGAIEFKQFGVALGVAVLVDATIVRAVLLPSAMTLLGHRNWYLPRWLEWAARGRAPSIAATARQPGSTIGGGNGDIGPPSPPIAPPAARHEATTDGSPRSKETAAG